MGFGIHAAVRYLLRKSHVVQVVLFDSRQALTHMGVAPCLDPVHRNTEILVMTLFSQGYSIIPHRKDCHELVRPWKLVTLAFGMAWLVHGALSYGIADWDVGVSIVMGLLTYVCAPWSVFVIGSAVTYRPRFWWAHVGLGLLVAVLVVDSSYLAYHALAGNETYRWDNFKASLPLYGICGVGWLYRGSLRDLLTDVRHAVLEWRER